MPFPYNQTDRVYNATKMKINKRIRRIIMSY